MTPRATPGAQDDDDDENSAAARSESISPPSSREGVSRDVLGVSRAPSARSCASLDRATASWDDARGVETKEHIDSNSTVVVDVAFKHTRARVDAVRALIRAGRCADAMRMIESTPARAFGGDAIALALGGECREGAGETAAAFRAFRASRDADGNPDAWCGLARLAHDAGALEEAVACFRAATRGYEALGWERDAEETRARLARAWTDAATALKARGDAVSAVETYREIIDALPRYAAAAHYNLGVALVEAGRLDEAERAYRASAALEPTRAEAYCNIGVVFKMTNRVDDAVRAFEQCLRISPEFALGRKNLSLVLTDQGTELKKTSPREAAATYERALTYDSTNVEAYYNLGVAYAEMEEYDRAIIAYENAGRLRPQCAEIWNNAGVLYKERGNDARATEYYRRAVACNPNFAQPLNNLGVLYTMSGQAQQALESLQRAVTVDPSYSVAHNNIGVLLRDTGDIEHACDAYRECVKHSPNDRHAEQNYLLALNYVRQGEEPEVCEAHAAWGSRFAKLAGPPLKPRRAVRADSGAGTSGRRKLVVGYVSPDMYTHSVSYFAAAPLRAHDAERVACVVYNVSKFRDEQTERLKKYTLESGGEWRECASLTESQLARAIRDDGVDVLVELTGHTANNRLGALALEPAPVQITWIGYPNSTGLRSVNYRITDDTCDPCDTKQTFTEELVRMPSPYSFLCYTPNPEAPAEVSAPPCVTRGYVTFGCFNTMAKVTPAVRAVWSEILLATPGSRLYFKSKAFACAVIRQRFLSQMAALGVENWRIDCVPLEPATSSHLAMYDGVDIALDTFPYAGTTTTCEALYMGVPVVTLAGHCHAHNVGKSLMTTIGHKEFIAENVNEYVRIASTMANDAESIRRVRARLRETLLRSPLCDAEGFTRALESVYCELWQRWCDEQAREDSNDEESDVDESDAESEGRGARCSAEDSKGESNSSNDDTAELYEDSGTSAEGEFSSRLIDNLEI